jgi:hypothetical protein
VPRYLSLDWLDAMSVEVASSDELRAAAAGRAISVTQVVTGGPDGDVTYHLAVGGGEARFGPGAAAEEHVRFVEDWGTAVAVATGTLSAQEAFIRGRIKLIGDQQRLVDAQPVFAALDGVLTRVRGDTTYA